MKDNGKLLNYIDKIICVQLLPRTSTRYVLPALYNNLVIQVNQHLKHELAANSNVFYWKLKGVKHSSVNLFKDGVHFNDLGFHRYYKNLRGAVIRCLE